MKNVSKFSGALCAFAVVALLGGTASANELTGGVWAVNDSLDFGQSLSDHKPAVVAELTYGFANDLYVGGFTTSVHDGVDYGQEFRLMAGVEKTLKGEVEVNAFVVHHAFTGTGDFHQDSFWEVEVDASRSFGPVTAVAALVGSPVDGGGGLEGFAFLGVESEIELPRGFAWQSSFGRMMLSEHLDGAEDSFHSTTGLQWTHSSGFALFLGAERISLGNDVHPVVRVGRAF
jgi:hypothetical protein